MQGYAVEWIQAVDKQVRVDLRVNSRWNDDDEI